jgi:hypothetical protein
VKRARKFVVFPWGLTNGICRLDPKSRNNDRNTQK